MDTAQQLPARLQDLYGVSGVQQFLAGRAGHEAEREGAGVRRMHGWHGRPSPEPGQQRALTVEPELGIRTFVGLLHDGSVAEGAVGVAMLQRTHPPVISDGPVRRHPDAWPQPTLAVAESCPC